MWQMSSLLPSMTEWPSETNEYLANHLEYEEIVRWDTENVNNMYVFGLKVFWVCITLEVPGNVCKLKKWFFQEIYPSRESTRRLPVFLTLINYYWIELKKQC